MAPVRVTSFLTRNISEPCGTISWQRRVGLTGPLLLTPMGHSFPVGARSNGWACTTPALGCWANQRWRSGLLHCQIELAHPALLLLREQAHTPVCQPQMQRSTAPSCRAGVCGKLRPGTLVPEVGGQALLMGHHSSGSDEAQNQHGENMCHRTR